MNFINIDVKAERELFDVEKKFANKFWIHNVIIEKSPETLNPNHS